LSKRYSQAIRTACERENLTSAKANNINDPYREQDNLDLNDRIRSVAYGVKKLAADQQTCLNSYKTIC